VESSISKIPRSMLSNPNLDAADTGVDPSTGKYLSNRERIAIFKKRKIDVKRVFGKRTDLSKFGAIVKAPKPIGVEDRIADIEKTLITIGDNFKRLQNFVINNELLNRKYAIDDERLLLKEGERKKFDKQEEELEENKELKKTFKVPLAGVAKKAQGFLQSLLKAFGFLFAGWLSDKAFKFFDALKSGDKNVIEDIKNKVITSSAQVLGVFLFMNAFIAKLPAIIAGVATSVAKLGLLIGKFLLTPAGIKALAVLGGGYLLAKYVIEPGVKSIANTLAGGIRAEDDTKQAFRQAFANEEQKLIAAGVQPPSNVNSPNAMLIDVAGQDINMGIDQNTGQFGDLYLKSINPETNKPYATPEQLKAFEEYKKNVKAIRRIEETMRDPLKDKNLSDEDKLQVQEEAVDTLASKGFLQRKDFTGDFETIDFSTNNNDNKAELLPLEKYIDRAKFLLEDANKEKTTITNINAGGEGSGQNMSYNQSSGAGGLISVNAANDDDFSKTESSNTYNIPATV